MQLYPEYKDYNVVEVTLATSLGNYTISNINKKANFPGRKIDNVQLQSISIKGPSIGGGDQAANANAGTSTNAQAATANADQSSTSGTIVVADYRHTLFNLLSGELDGVINNDSNASITPPILIKISCYTGTIEFQGNILSWNMSYSGTMATITINWSVIAPNWTPPEQIRPGTYQTPNGFITTVQSDSGQSYPIVFVDEGKEYFDLDSKLKINGNFYYEPDKLDSIGGNYLVSAYAILTQHATTKSGDPLGYYVENGKFIIYNANPKKSTAPRTPETETSDLVFVQNGKWLPYRNREDGKLVIPLTSFSTEYTNTNLSLMGNVRGSLNGHYTLYNNSYSMQTGNISQVESSNQSTADQPQNDPVIIKIECYNTMCFSINNIEQTIALECYDESGLPIPTLCVNAVIRSVEYDFSGAVVKASIECTNVFNINEATVTMDDIYNENLLSSLKDYSNSANDDSAFVNMSYDPSMSIPSENQSSSDSSSSSQQSSDNSSNSNPTDYKKYLCSEDKKVTSLSLDRTEILLNNGEFDMHVNEFLKSYGSANGANRYISYSFVQNLIASGDYGLLTLLLAVANYGVSGAPANWSLDAVNLNPDYKKKKPFCASNTGKAPFDHTKGGLGIAHWDSGNLDDIYTTIGFDKSDVATQAQKDHFKSLLVTDNSITGWKPIKFNGIDRVAPVFSKKYPSIRLFDKGLKQDSAWVAWAKKVVYYRTDSGDYIYNKYLFRLWVQKFWTPTISTLKKKQSTASHKIGIQDAVRIARAGNSATGLIYSSAGKNVQQQYQIYYNDKERYIRQKAFCRRCADIIGYCT